jgi:hypothetical protein
LQMTGIGGNYHQCAEQQFEMTTSRQRLDALTALYERLMNADWQ